MRRFFLVLSVLIGFTTNQAQAAEYGLGLGRMYGCLSRYDDDGRFCAKGPAFSLHAGLNLWGKDYDPTTGDKSLVSNWTESSTHWSGNFFSHVTDWEDLVVVMFVAVVMISVGYALLYPFSSRVDMGVIGQSGLQQQSSDDLKIWRNEAGVYIRGYMSQHFPVYIYGSGTFSHQNIRQGAAKESHDVFVKRAGLGIMDPRRAGPYLQGLWERSSLLDPTAKDLIKDAGTNKIRRKSVEGILDASYFELGYLWYH